MHINENGHVTTNGQSDRKMKTNVNEIVARHSPKISPISKLGECVKQYVGEQKLNTKELSGYCVRPPVHRRNISHKGTK